MTPVKDDELSARVDSALRRALAATPSPEFLPRVRARVAERASSRRPPWWWLAPAGLAAAATLVVALQFRAHTPSAPMSPTVTSDTAAPGTTVAPRTIATHQAPTRHPAPTRHQAPTRHEAPLRHQAPARTRHQAPGTRHPSDLMVPAIPDVLVSRTDAIAFERFVTGLAQGRIDASAWASDPLPAGPPARIAIAPIDIRPLTPDR